MILHNQTDYWLELFMGWPPTFYSYVATIYSWNVWFTCQSEINSLLSGRWLTILHKPYHWQIVVFAQQLTHSPHWAMMCGWVPHTSLSCVVCLSPSYSTKRYVVWLGSQFLTKLCCVALSPTPYWAMICDSVSHTSLSCVVCLGPVPH